MDGTIAAAVRLPCDGGRSALGQGHLQVTSPLDDDESLEADDGKLLGVLSQVQRAYRRLLQSSNCLATSHGMIADSSSSSSSSSCIRVAFTCKSTSLVSRS